MQNCAIFSAYYYLDNQQLTYKGIPKFIDKTNMSISPLPFSDFDKLSIILNNINTRMIDLQSLSLQAAVSQASKDEFYNTIDKSDISVVAGSFSAALYPICEFILSAKEKGVNFVNATQFTNTVGNAAASRLCIWNQFKNRVSSICNGINSGLDAIISTCDDINYKNSSITFACATEEIGAAAFLIAKDNILQDKAKPLAYIKNYESKYVGTENIGTYLQNLANHFNLDLAKTDFYLSGSSDLLNDTFKNKNCNIKIGINKEALSLTPMINIGNALFEYENNNKNDCIIISVNNIGFVSVIQLVR
ncbi:MAG: 3-oxoacyl-[acyl-carrier-protein] synthase II [Eubacteriales bacterium SKADARSKE-1]|nr:3-oxoacyl-[acyl-carrier-protein] synthase II [Eubacteriales bacterium SKADARSKE-1]